MEQILNNEVTSLKCIDLGGTELGHWVLVYTLQMAMIKTVITTINTTAQPVLT